MYILMLYVIISYTAIGILDSIVILFFDGKVTSDAVFLFLLAPVSLPFIAIKLIKKP